MRMIDDIVEEKSQATNKQEDDREKVEDKPGEEQGAVLCFSPSYEQKAEEETSEGDEKNETEQC